MIDLNDDKFNILPTEDELLKKIPSYEIFKYYIKEDLKVGKPIKSPLRGDDIHPSFSLYQYDKNPNIILYKDFGSQDKGNAIRFVSKLFNISILEAIEKILKEVSIDSTGMIYETETKNPVTIKVKSRNWESFDKEYWESYGVSIDLLHTCNCRPVEYYFIDDHVFKADKYSYAFREFKDERITFKIYQPFNTKEFKFINNHPSSVHQGYTTLPQTGDVLIITKSYKDVYCLRYSFKQISVGIQGEYVVMKPQVVDEYKSRFKRQYTLFDNDSAGRQLADTYEKLYNIKSLFIPDKYGVKDISDYYKFYKTEHINFSKL